MSLKTTLVKVTDIITILKKRTLNTYLNPLSIITVLSIPPSTAPSGGGIPADAVLYDDGVQVFYDDGVYVPYVA